jgi:glycosyltransferase involved in cell wall biosynthesis
MQKSAMTEASFSRFVVASDEGDWSWTGHNHFYSISVARAAVNQGFRATILAPIGATAGSESGVEIHPYVRPQLQLVGSRQTIRRWALKYIPPRWSRHAAVVGRKLLGAVVALRFRLSKSSPTIETVGVPPGSFGSQIAEAIRTGVLASSDFVFVHTILTQSLESLLLALRPIEQARLPCFRLTLRTDPGELATKFGRRLELKDILVGFWHEAHLRERVRFLTDTQELKLEFDALSPFVFREIPIPVAVPQIPPGHAERKTKTLKITYVGAIRRERGFQLLPGLARHLAERRLSEDIHLVVQAGGLDQTDDPLVRRVLTALEAYPDTVTVVKGSLTPDRYAALLHSADLILLPYDGSRYRARSSGILAEALVLGCPTVVPNGTWMSRVANGSCICIQPPGDARSLCTAVDKALNELSELQASAMKMSSEWRTSATPNKLFVAVATS